MKAISLVALLSVLLLTGCNDSAGPKDSASSGNLATAPVDYLNNAAKAQQRAVKTVDLTAVNKAIETFYVQEGRFPKDLLELAELKYLPRIPEPPPGLTWNYDTNSGTATLEKKLE